MRWARAPSYPQITTPKKTSIINTKSKSYRPQSQVLNLKSENVNNSKSPQKISQASHSFPPSLKALNSTPLKKTTKLCFSKYDYNNCCNIANIATMQLPILQKIQLPITTWRIDSKTRGTELNWPKLILSIIMAKKIGIREVTNPTSRTTTLAVAMIKSISMYLFFFTYLVVSRWLIYSEIEKSQQQSQKQSRFAIVIMLLLYTRTMISVLMFHFCVQRNSSWVVFSG